MVDVDTPYFVVSLLPKLSVTKCTGKGRVTGKVHAKLLFNRGRALSKVWYTVQCTIVVTITVQCKCIGYQLCVQKSQQQTFTITIVRGEDTKMRDLIMCPVGTKKIL